MSLITFGHQNQKPPSFTKVAAPDRRGGFLIRTGTGMAGDAVGGGGFVSGVGQGVGIGVGLLGLAFIVAMVRGRQIA